jgi:type 1 glutamine amidotransferase
MKKFNLLLLLGMLFLLAFTTGAAAQSHAVPAKHPRKVLVLAEQATGHQGFVDAATSWLNSVADSLNVTFTYVYSMKDVKAGEIDKYQAIIQLNYPPYAWSEAAAADFERYIDQGHGGYVGFHHATLLGDIFDGYKMWQWFSDFMGHIRFDRYITSLADGTVCVEDDAHPVMRGLPCVFDIPKDEWYTYDSNPRKHVHVLAHVDEASYRPASDIRMGDHPVIWTNPSKKARNVYFQIGHHADLLTTPAFIRMFGNAILWVLGDIN